MVVELKNQYNDYFGDEEKDEEEEDLTGSVWMPVVVENKSERELLKDPNVREMNLAAISEKEVFVRKANLVISFF